MTVTYEDFSIRIDRDHDQEEWVCRLVESPYGGGDTRLHLGLSSNDMTRIQELLKSSLSSSGPDDPIFEGLPHSITTARELGEHLFSSLFTGELGVSYNRSRGRVESLPDAGLRIKIIVDPHAPGTLPLLCLPWELLADRQGFLCRNPFISIVRFLRSSRRLKPADSKERLRILLATPSPRGLEVPNREREVSRLLELIQSRADLDCDFVDSGSFKDLARKLQQGKFDVFHFIGHGKLNSTSGEGGLYFEDPKGRPKLISGEILAENIRYNRHVRLAVLNACDTARTLQGTTRYGLGGVASALVLSEVPAVVAMQFPISDTAALCFTEAMYGGLVEGKTLDTICTNARLAIHEKLTGGLEWLTPVLFLSSQPEDIFSIGRSPEEGAGDTLQNIGENLTGVWRVYIENLDVWAPAYSVSKMFGMVCWRINIDASGPSIRQIIIEGLRNEPGSGLGESSRMLTTKLIYDSKSLKVRLTSELSEDIYEDFTLEKFGHDVIYGEYLLYDPHNGAPGTGPEYQGKLVLKREETAKRILLQPV